MAINDRAWWWIEANYESFYAQAMASAMRIWRQAAPAIMFTLAGIEKGLLKRLLADMPGDELVPAVKVMRKTESLTRWDDPQTWADTGAAVREYTDEADVGVCILGAEIIAHGMAKDCAAGTAAELDAGLAKLADLLTTHLPPDVQYHVWPANIWPQIGFSHQWSKVFGSTLKAAMIHQEHGFKIREKGQTDAYYEKHMDDIRATPFRERGIFYLHDVPRAWRPEDIRDILDKDPRAILYPGAARATAVATQIGHKLEKIAR